MTWDFNMAELYIRYSRVSAASVVRSPALSPPCRTMIRPFPSAFVSPMLPIPPTAFPGFPHHVVPRGASHEPVFLDADDRLDFIDIVRRAADGAGLEIWAWALMTNHVHMIAVPDDRESISETMSEALRSYAVRFKTRHGLSGEVWHRRCHAAMIQLRYLWNAVRYVERNPVRAGIVRRSEDYRWSSAVYHSGLVDSDPLVSPTSPLKGALGHWADWLAEPDSDPLFAYIRRKNRPAEGERRPDFIGHLERELDRRIARGQKSRTREIGDGD